ncbi:hypothetical protein [Palleronia sp.]|uniref:hypothetical protein n=1 Tax=Palleronia sp. TaxID=1940284 RepID=UPI0035C82835
MHLYLCERQDRSITRLSVQRPCSAIGTFPAALVGIFVNLGPKLAALIDIERMALHGISERHDAELKTHRV